MNVPASNFRDRVEILAMDRFSGHEAAAVEVLPNAVTVMVPFPVVAWPGTSWTCAAERVQQDTTATMGEGLLTERQEARIGAVFADDAHAAAEVTWCVCQQLIDAECPPRCSARPLRRPTRSQKVRGRIPSGARRWRQLSGVAATLRPPVRDR